jgi:hypothetical protein
VYQHIQYDEIDRVAPKARSDLRLDLRSVGDCRARLVLITWWPQFIVPRDCFIDVMLSMAALPLTRILQDDGVQHCQWLVTQMYHTVSTISVTVGANLRILSPYP